MDGVESESRIYRLESEIKYLKGLQNMTQKITMAVSSILL